MGQLITMYMLRVYSMCVDMYVYVVMMIVIMITINTITNNDNNEYHGNESFSANRVCNCL